ncbi:MAG: hypothetical protein ABSF64_31075 [Bryobacteraceae bacterium]|jgi:hypothetical protein
MKNPNEPRQPSQAQIDANRENAQKSTGPRTAAGKAASSRNRLVHGLRANKHIMLDEDPEEFLLRLHDHLDRLQPVGPVEEDLVVRIAGLRWRLNRAFPLEAGIYRDLFQRVADKDQARQKQYAMAAEFAKEKRRPAPPPPIPPDARDLLARAFSVDASGPNSSTKLTRYETSIERSIDRCLNQLKVYQATRLADREEPVEAVGQAVPPAEAVEQAVPPAEAAAAEGEGEVGQAVPPADQPVTPHPTPPESANCHSNPNDRGGARCGLVALVLLVALVAHALLRAVSPLLGTPGHARTELSAPPARIPYRHKQYGNLAQEAIAQVDLVPPGAPARGRGAILPQSHRPQLAENRP